MSLQLKKGRPAKNALAERPFQLVYLAQNGSASESYTQLQHSHIKEFDIVV